MKLLGPCDFNIEINYWSNILDTGEKMGIQWDSM